jgi:hypothetical protein
MKTKKPVAKKQDMAVSELAGMVARGFTEMRGDIKELRSDMDIAFEQVNGRVTKVEQKVDRLQNSVDEFTYDHRKIKTRIENLEMNAFGAIREA